MEVYDYLLSKLETEYELEQELKHGPRGSVSLLRHRQSGTRFICRRYTGSAEVYQKLLSVSCRNLPQVMEATQHGDEAVVLEEYIQGDNLGVLLEGALFTTAEAKKILLQLCEGVWALHSLGAVHRDIKPENVILRGDEAVLIDFDASRIYKKERDADTQILGTTGYAAPEQYGLTQSDGRADIYALGVLLNVMLTGTHPSKKLAGGKMGRVIQKCTMTSPKKRYKNVLYLMEAL